MATGSRATPDVMESIAAQTGRPAFMVTVLTMHNEADPDKALLMEAYIHGIENRNPVMRFFRRLDRTFRSANKKQYSKYNVALDLKISGPYLGLMLSF